MRSATPSRGPESGQGYDGQVLRRALYRGSALPVSIQEDCPHRDPASRLDPGWVAAFSPEPRHWESAVAAAAEVLAQAPDDRWADEAAALLAFAQERARGARGRWLAAALAPVPLASAAAITLAGPRARATAAVLGSMCCAVLATLAMMAASPQTEGRPLAPPSAGGDAATGFEQGVLVGFGMTPAADGAAMGEAGVTSPTPSRAVARAGRRRQATAGPADEVVQDAQAEGEGGEPGEQASSPAAAGAGSGEERSAGAAGGGGGLAYTALAKEAPMPFISASFGDQSLWVSQTEVTEAQWMTIMGIDLSVLFGTSDHPAQHLSACDALRFANRVSEHEGFRPVYDVPRDCERGGSVRIARRADGFRLMGVDEWRQLVVGDAPPAPVVALAASVWTQAPDARGVVGLQSGVGELVWTGSASEGPASVALIGCPSTELDCPRAIDPNAPLLHIGMRLVRRSPLGRADP